MSKDKLWAFAKYIVGFENLTRRVVRSWSDKQVRAASKYFLCVWMRVNDNDVKSVPCPRFVKEAVA